MRRIATIAARADRLCARLNDGLLAVAIVLAIVTAALSAARHMQAVVPTDAEWPVADVKN